MTLHLESARRYVERYHWYIFPVHAPIFDEAGDCTGCTCENYRRSKKCRDNHPHLYLGPNGKCSQPGKCPAVKWAARSTVDLAMIQIWFAEPWYGVDVETGNQIRWTPNIGVDCSKSNLLTLDADTYKKFCGDLADLLTWDDRKTVTSLTGGGGEHLVYDRQGKPYGNSTKGLPPGIDIRGAGGYIVVPPSMHKSGRRYRYEEGYGPRDIPLLPIPPKLDAILAKATPIHTQRGDPNLVIPALLRRSVRAVERLLKQTDINASDSFAYGDGVRWLMYDCPFMPEDNPHASDTGAFIIVLPDGRIAAGCQHNRCRKRIEESEKTGWALLCDLVGYKRTQRQHVLAEVRL